ncbi:MAG: hypothetical protein KDD70_12625 [Bdellovibrionales bacterium]|nr:hypothetical protein [Bdellovibrionales bacterium]
MNYLESLEIVSIDDYSDKEAEQGDIPSVRTGSKYSGIQSHQGEALVGVNSS